jgi:hypothetical protein
MFEHAKEHREVHRALLGSNAEPSVRRHLHSALCGIVRQEVTMELLTWKCGNGPVSPELLTHFLVSSYISVLN